YKIEKRQVARVASGSYSLCDGCTVPIRIERAMADPAASNYISGDTHVHRSYGNADGGMDTDTAKVEVIGQAEELKVANLMAANSSLTSQSREIVWDRGRLNEDNSFNRLQTVSRGG